MGVLCDYFVVAEGVDPAVVLDEPGGPQIGRAHV